MADDADVRRIALALPEVQAEEGTERFLVAGKAFVWCWRERVPEQRTKVERPDVLVVRVPQESDKFELCAADPEVFFTEPHYDGYRAVLVRLARIGVPELTEVLTESWRCAAPRRLLDPR